MNNEAQEVMKTIEHLRDAVLAKNTCLAAADRYCDAMRCLKQLPKRQKQIMGYKYLIGYSNAQVADKMDVSIKTIEAEVTAAKKRILEIA